MNNTLSLRYMLVLCSLVLLAGCASNEMQPVQRLSADGYQIDLLAADGVLKSGVNALALEVTQNGQSVTVSEAKATFSMPAMGTMPYMETAAQFQATSTQPIEGNVQFSMAGGWNVQLEVQTPQGPLSGSFNVQVVE